MGDGHHKADGYFPAAVRARKHSNDIKESVPKQTRRFGDVLVISNNEKQTRMSELFLGRQ